MGWGARGEMRFFHVPLRAINTTQEEKHNHKQEAGLRAQSPGRSQNTNSRTGRAQTPGPARLLSQHTAGQKHDEMSCRRTPEPREEQRPHPQGSGIACQI